MTKVKGDVLRREVGQWFECGIERSCPDMRGSQGKGSARYRIVNTVLQSFKLLMQDEIMRAAFDEEA